MKTIISLNIWDYIPIGFYILFLVWIGFKQHPQKNDESFILSARRLTLPAFVATLVSTWYGGILGVGEFTYLYGISNWIVFGVPYYIFGIVFARFLVPRLKSSDIITIPDLFEREYGRMAGVLSGVFVYILTNPAPYLLMSGLIFTLILPIPIFWALLIIGIISTIYIVRGGFASVVRTDILQFILMFAGFILLIIFAISKLGSPVHCWNKLPLMHKTLTGGNSIAYIAIWYIMAIVTLVDPNFYQRVFAAKDTRTAQKGIYISVFLWFVFDMLTTWSGLYARAFITIDQPTLSYPILANQLLPPFFKGVFIVALLATIMSSLDSFYFSAAVTLGRDIISRMLKKSDYYPYFIFSLIFTIALSVIMSIVWPSVIQLWYGIATIAIPPLIFPLIFALWYSRKPAPIVIIISMILSSILVLMDLLLATVHQISGSYFIRDSEPMITGITFNILFFVFYYMFSGKRHR